MLYYFCHYVEVQETYSGNLYNQAICQVLKELSSLKTSAFKKEKKKERTIKSQYGILIQQKETLHHNTGSCCTEIPILF